MNIMDIQIFLDFLPNLIWIKLTRMYLTFEIVSRRDVFPGSSVQKQVMFPSYFRLDHFKSG